MSRRVFILAERVTVREAAKILTLSPSSVRAYCEAGRFNTASKTGTGRTAPWKIDRDEILINQPQLKPMET